MNKVIFQSMRKITDSVTRTVKEVSLYVVLPLVFTGIALSFIGVK